MVCIWLLTTNGFAQNTIKGDGNIITKEISISDYDEISYVGKVNIEYEQSNASPFFKITIDENILPHLDIKINGKTLIIQPKNEKKYFFYLEWIFARSGELRRNLPAAVCLRMPVGAVCDGMQIPCP